MISFENARAKVIEILSSRGVSLRSAALSIETIDLSAEPSRALGRILAENIVADRNYPPFNRSIRDGFALRSVDALQSGAKLRLIGESRAGVAFDGAVGPGECIRILTGAPVPPSADTVVMHEFTHLDGDFVVFDQAARPEQHFVLAGSEARMGEVVVPQGARLGYAELAVAAEVGHTIADVKRRPRVAILSTGDELVNPQEKPGPFQIRNSNNISLAAQVAAAGGEPILAGHARDDISDLRTRIERGLESDMLILSGGVSVGKYDFVENVLQELGAETIFDAVAIRPGKPIVFAWCRAKPVFGLPGNPVSTMVTFELFVVPAIEILAGHPPQPVPLFKAMLAHSLDEKGSVAHFLPSRVSWPAGDSRKTPKVELIPWQGSGDIGAVTRGNCFLVVYPSQPRLEAGAWVDVLPRLSTL
jgi:molybdopterin molybdotransferase